MVDEVGKAEPEVVEGRNVSVTESVGEIQEQVLPQGADEVVVESEGEKEGEIPLEKRNMKLWVVGIVLGISVLAATGVLLYYRARLLLVE